MRAVSLPRKLLASLATVGLVALVILGVVDDGDVPFTTAVIAHVE